VRETHARAFSSAGGTKSEAAGGELSQDDRRWEAHSCTSAKQRGRWEGNRRRSRGADPWQLGGCAP